MKKKPWYVWLSFFSLIILMGRDHLNIKVMITEKYRKGWGMHSEFMIQIFHTFLLLFVLPLFIIGLLIWLTKKYLVADIGAVQIICDIVHVLTAYLLGINAIIKYVKWREKYPELKE